jgi:hypothetical protein
VAVKKAVLQEVGPFADMRVSGDFDMWTRISKGHPIGFIRESLVELRSHADQFSRREGEGLHFIRENEHIFGDLWEALPKELQQYARSFQRRQRSVWNLHYMVRSVIMGRLHLAHDVFLEVRKEGYMPTLILLWALTANGRFFRPKPRYLQPVACEKTGAQLLRRWTPEDSGQED